MTEIAVPVANPTASSDVVVSASPVPAEITPQMRKHLSRLDPYLICGECEACPAEIDCLDCQESYCANCYRSAHQKGFRRNHKNFKPIHVCQHCHECAATMVCDDCNGKLFCDRCHRRVHTGRGKLRKHTNYEKISERNERKIKEAIEAKRDEENAMGIPVSTLVSKRYPMQDAAFSKVVATVNAIAAEPHPLGPDHNKVLDELNSKGNKSPLAKKKQKEEEEALIPATKQDEKPGSASSADGQEPAKKKRVTGFVLPPIENEDKHKLSSEVEQPHKFVDVDTQQLKTGDVEIDQLIVGWRRLSNIMPRGAMFVEEHNGSMRTSLPKSIYEDPDMVELMRFPRRSLDLTLDEDGFNLALLSILHGFPGVLSTSIVSMEHHQKGMFAFQFFDLHTIPELIAQDAKAARMPLVNPIPVPPKDVPNRYPHSRAPGRSHLVGYSPLHQDMPKQHGWPPEPPRPCPPGTGGPTPRQQLSQLLLDGPRRSDADASQAVAEAAGRRGTMLNVTEDVDIDFVYSLFARPASQVIVDDLVPMSGDGKPLFGLTENDLAEKWKVMLMKAYAKFRGEYSALNATNPALLLKHMTGGRAIAEWWGADVPALSHVKKAQNFVWWRIKTAKALGQIVLLWTTLPDEEEEADLAMGLEEEDSEEDEDPDAEPTGEVPATWGGQEAALKRGELSATADGAIALFARECSAKDAAFNNIRGPVLTIADDSVPEAAINRKEWQLVKLRQLGGAEGSSRFSYGHHSKLWSKSLREYYDFRSTVDDLVYATAEDICMNFDTICTCSGHPDVHVPLAHPFVIRASPSEAARDRDTVQIFLCLRPNIQTLSIFDASVFDLTAGEEKNATSSLTIKLHPVSRSRHGFLNCRVDLGGAAAESAIDVPPVVMVNPQLGNVQEVPDRFQVDDLDVPVVGSGSEDEIGAAYVMTIQATHYKFAGSGVLRFVEDEVAYAAII